MRFLSRLSTSGRACCCRGLGSGSWRGCRGPQTPVSLLSLGERLVGAGRWARSWVHLLALGVQGLFRSIAPAPNTPASPWQTPPASAFPLPSAGAAGGRVLPKRFTADEEVALEEPLPDVHSCALLRPAARQAARGGRGAGRGDGAHIGQAVVSPCHTQWGHRDRSCCLSVVPAKVSPACPLGVSPCPVPTESSEWEFQYFLWQRSLQPNYHILTSFLFA